MKLYDLFDLFLIDMDGVVYLGDKPIPNAVEAINELRDKGKKIVFLTNDPRNTRVEYAKRLTDMGIHTEPHDIVTSAMALAQHIESNHTDLHNKKVYVVGSDKLKKSVERTGLRLVTGEEAKTADFVVLGGHPDFHYEEMKIANLAIRNGAEFYATNRDPAFPTPEGHVPATGAILASVEIASGKSAKVAGKPELIMFEVAMLATQNTDRTRVAVIGDRLDTDILGGINAGIKTILCLSGSTHIDDVEGSQIMPDFVISDLGELFKEEDLCTSSRRFEH